MLRRAIFQPAIKKRKAASPPQSRHCSFSPIFIHLILSSRQSFSVLSGLFGHGKLILSHTAQRAYPVPGNVLECRSGSDSVLRISRFGIIYVAAYITNILLHDHHLFLSEIIMVILIFMPRPVRHRDVKSRMRFLIRALGICAARGTSPGVRNRPSDLFLTPMYYNNKMEKIQFPITITDIPRPARPAGERRLDLIISHKPLHGNQTAADFFSGPVAPPFRAPGRKGILLSDAISADASVLYRFPFLNKIVNSSPRFLTAASAVTRMIRGSWWSVPL